MKKIMGIAVVALMMAGSVAFACDTCGCKEKKAEKKDCSSCSAEKKCENCTAEKKCEACTKKSEEAKKAEAAE